MNSESNESAAATPRIQTVRPDLDGLRLDRALSELFPDFSRSFLARLIDQRHVRIDTEVATKPSHRVAAGQQVAIDFPPPVPTSVESQEIPLIILYEDADLVVIDKPAGLVVHPAAGHADGTLVNALLFHIRDLSGLGGELRPGIVHRLDKDTSGVMLIAKGDEAHRRLTEAWNTDAVRKEYLALVYGTPKEAKGTIDAAIGRDARDRKRMAVVAGGRRAITDYEVLERLRHASLVRLRLRTGRTHQIRVHMKHLGHPIVGDPVYSGPQWRGIPDKKVQKALAALDRQALHAARITLPHPRTGEVMTFEAALPEDMARALRALA
ncbi:MAG TPA: RluA family pseudouridine synthase [Thermoanaerobaculia bacterium]|nr:RluA family pseudouridine synthase [Thermoanaerobaculia bacterium]